MIGYEYYLPVPKLTKAEEAAWNLYCQHTAGCLSAKDFWWELSADEQNWYLISSYGD